MTSGTFSSALLAQPKGYLMAKNKNIPFSDIIHSYHSHYSMHKPWLYFHKSKKKIHNDKIKTWHTVFLDQVTLNSKDYGS